MREIDFMSSLHKSTARDYLARVNDPVFPKAKASRLAKEYGFDYWDGDRRINYGGYNYIPGRFATLAKKLIQEYSLSENSRILDIGCGKGFLLYELMLAVPGLKVVGVDISRYAIENSHDEVKDFLIEGSATGLPFQDDSFDLVISINTLHNLYNFELYQAFREISRVSRDYSYVCVESYRTEEEKANLLYWQVTCESFYTPEEWKWFMSLSGYRGDYSFICFE